MKNMQSIDDIKKYNLPEIDVKASVMSRIEELSNAKRRRRPIKKMVIILAACISIFSLMGFATYQMLELKGSNGVSYKFRLFNNSESIITRTLTEESKKLNPGQTVIIMSSMGKQKNNFTQYTKPVILGNVEELSLKLGEKYKSTSYIPEGFSLKECSVEYKYTPFSEESMTKEWEDTGKELVVKVLEPTSEIAEYSLMYAKGVEQIYFQVRNFERNEVAIGSSDLGQSLKKVMINEVEAAYTENGQNYMLSWLTGEGTGKTAYSIRYLNSEKNQGEGVQNMLIKIAENIK